MSKNQPRKARRYTVLPDGTIHFLDGPGDYKEARDIARDLLGPNMLVRLDDAE